MKSEKASRRRFMKHGVALAGVALGARGIASGQSGTATTESGRGSGRDTRVYGEPSHFETARRFGSNHADDAPFPAGAKVDFGYRSPVQDVLGYITPASLHYSITHGVLPDDKINPKEHRFTLHGMVDRPLIFTMDEMKRLPSVCRVHLVQCRGDGSTHWPERIGPQATPQWTHGYSSCSVWEGVLLSTLLKEAGVKSGATWILAEGAEPAMHSKSIPLAKAMEDCLLAWGQNGEAVRPEQGYPLRLVAPGFQGINSVKWLRRIKVVDEPYMANSETGGYTELMPDGKAIWFNSELGPNSVITRPSGTQQLPVKGLYEIRGLAWSGGGSVRRVEVSTNGGKTWANAEIQGPVHRIAYTRFTFGWTWNGEEALLKSRCTDDRGAVQPTWEEYEKIWGVPKGWVKTPPGSIPNFNAIQTWKVNRDGRVENALFS